MVDPDPAPAPWNLPAGISQSYVQADDLKVHILEAGSPSDPLVLLLHGFPELAYSWRKILVPLARAGFHVVAPDMRGYGRTCDAPVPYDADLTPYAPLAAVRDVVALVAALRTGAIFAVVGHDMGSLVAGNCALLRPDLFARVVCMSSPYTGAPLYAPLGTRGVTRPPALAPMADRALRALDLPRKHYTVYFSTPTADADMRGSPGGLSLFLRAYYHAKSADCAGNAPHELVLADGAGPDGVVRALAELPEYYVMRAERDMPASVLPLAPSRAEVAEQSNRWLPEDELAVYAAEFSRTGFQGGLNKYRCATDAHGRWAADLLAFSGRAVEVPAMFVAGKKDWGTWQFPGAVKAMEKVLAKMEGRFELVEGAGHWVQQEQPEAVVALLVDFFKKTA